MKIFKYERKGDIRKTYILGLPVATRKRSVYANGGGGLSM